MVASHCFLQKLLIARWVLAFIPRKGLGTTSGRSNSGIPEITGGVDFKGKTSSAVAKLVFPGGTIGTFSGGSSDNFSVSVGFWAGMSAETEETVSEVSKSMTKCSFKDLEQR